MGIGEQILTEARGGGRPKFSHEVVDEKGRTVKRKLTPEEQQIFTKIVGKWKRYGPAYAEIPNDLLVKHMAFVNGLRKQINPPELNLAQAEGVKVVFEQERGDDFRREEPDVYEVRIEVDLGKLVDRMGDKVQTWANEVVDQAAWEAGHWYTPSYGDSDRDADEDRRSAVEDAREGTEKDVADYFSFDWMDVIDAMEKDVLPMVRDSFEGKFGPFILKSDSDVEIDHRNLYIYLRRP
jgi:hypothetical protein